jgi:RNA recognition motif-containing protein
MGSSIIILIIVAIIVILALAFLIRALRSRSRRSGGGGQEAEGESSQLYVGNLSYRVHERDLRRFFSKYGEITHLKVVKDRETRRSKGFGFVSYASPNEANRALVAHGEMMSGRNIVVRLAKPRS